VRPGFFRSSDYRTKAEPRGQRKKGHGNFQRQQANKEGGRRKKRNSLHFVRLPVALRHGKSSLHTAGMKESPFPRLALLPLFVHRR